MERAALKYLSKLYGNHFFDSVGVAFAQHESICDENGRLIDYKFLTINTIFEKMTGLKRENVIGKNLLQVLPETEPFWLEIYGKMLYTSEPIIFENYAKELDKHFKVIAFSNIKGQFSTLFIDITERKKNNDLKTKYELLSNSTSDIILFLHENGNIFDVNNSAINTYGYTYEELIELNVKELRQYRTLLVFDQQFFDAKTKGIVFETIHVRKDGSSFPVEVSSQVANSNGNIIVISIVRNISERKKNESDLLYLATYDDLTDIPNRHYLLKEFDLLIEHANRGKYTFAFLLFDVDKFKLINDTFGHETGDLVLKEIARKIKSIIRNIDFLARLGGDEFVILQSYIKSPQDCESLAKKILEAFVEPIKLINNNIIVSLSIGISIFSDHASDRESLMRFSDKAMYIAKEHGGNCYITYEA